MRRTQKREVLDCVQSLYQAHEEIKTALGRKDMGKVQNMLSECQEFAISLGETIESLEGEGHATVSYLEAYCEALFHINEELSNPTVNENKIVKTLKKQLLRIENSVNHDIPVRIEAVFLPYKASMWDSLESVWRAADADPDCDAYVIPIPYFDKNPDGSVKERHYEGDRYPEDVPVIPYDKFDFESHRPDMIFIHNPYDAANYVTSVHPFFYSENLKKYTDSLVYIPYFASAGGQGEALSLCPAYIYADYIVIQSEKFRQFYDERLQDEKFLALGSPKFDSVIRKCQDPPEPPKEWAEKMQGRKVYFYNTSLSGMLADTEAFLKKMRYVFDIFKGREDSCLLWRPHPLLESTFDSMRSDYKREFMALKTEFIEEGIGIYDDTPQIEDTIALSDVYVGDSGTSVTSLFGVVGKPLFILNNYIHTIPEEDDWRGEKIMPVFDPWGNDKYQVTENNQLWVSEKDDYHYRFYMDLGCEYSGGEYYLKALEIGEKIYVLPRHAREILVIVNKKIRRIPLQSEMVREWAFRGYWYNDDYIFLLPDRYPYLVRFEIAIEAVEYIDTVPSFNVRDVNGVRRPGGVCQYGNEIAFASPEDNQILFMDAVTMAVRCIPVVNKDCNGIIALVPDGEDLWILPYQGKKLTCWNPKSGQVREYGDVPGEFQSINWPYNESCEELPFGNVVVSRENGKETIIISPAWGNMNLKLDRETGRMEEWKLPLKFCNRGRNEYFSTSGMGGFITDYLIQGKPKRLFWYAPERKLYEVNIENGEYRDLEINFDYEDVKTHESGFGRESEWMQYCLKESALNSLKDYLDGKVTGEPYDRDKQIEAFSDINASHGEVCGGKIYEYVKGNAEVRK